MPNEQSDIAKLKDREYFKKYYYQNRSTLLPKDRLRMLLKRAIINKLSPEEISAKIAKQKERERNGTKKHQKEIKRQLRKEKSEEKKREALLLRKDKLEAKLRQLENEINK